MFHLAKHLKLILVALFATVILSGCGNQREQVHLSGPTMGTIYNVKYIVTDTSPKPEVIQAEINRLLEEVNDQMSTYRQDSELSRFNRYYGTEPLPVSRQTAMAGLGIPTTRALAMMVSDTPVYREQVEQGALLVRAANTHIRFGHFEHFFYTGQHEQLRLLADKVIEWHFPDCLDADKPYVAFFAEVVRLTAEMIAHWQAKGFAHGVMNTDNISVLGLTIDLNVFGWLERYDEEFVPNLIDTSSRYAYGAQPHVARWNLERVADAMTGTPFLTDREPVLIYSHYNVVFNNFQQLLLESLSLISYFWRCRV